MSPSSDASAGPAFRLMQVVGARPQFVKLAPLCRAIASANAGGARLENLVVHTGQHYDPAMSDVFFSELGIPVADLDLGVGSGSHGRQTARMLESLEAAMLERRPDLVLTTATPIRRWRRRSRPRSCACPSRTSRRACAASTVACPRRRTGWSRTTSRTCSSRRRRRR
jgi:hypothetical protein